VLASETAVVLIQPNRNEYLWSKSARIYLLVLSTALWDFISIESSPVFVAACFGSHRWQFPNLAREQPQRRKELVMISSQNKLSHLAHNQKPIQNSIYIISKTISKDLPPLQLWAQWSLMKKDRPCSTGWRLSITVTRLEQKKSKQAIVKCSRTSSSNRVRETQNGCLPQFEASIKTTFQNLIKGEAEKHNMPTQVPGSGFRPFNQGTL